MRIIRIAIRRLTTGSVLLAHTPGLFDHPEYQ